MKKIIYFSTLALSVALFSLLAALVFAGFTENFDSTIYTAISTAISSPLTLAAKAFSFIGSEVVVVAVVLVLLVIPRTRINFGLPIAVTVGCSAVLNWLLKHAFMRPRPEILRLVDITGFSFPSGHAMNNTALYTVLVLLVFKYAKSARVLIASGAYLLVFLIGLSRIYLGVHYASDVIAGFLLGYAVAAASYCIFIRLYDRERTLGG